MAIKLVAKQTLHQNIDLKILLPLLQANVQELNVKISNIRDENPFIEVAENSSLTRGFSSSLSENIEQLKDEEDTLFDTVLEQLDSHLFPTPKSLEIAKDILNDINEEGYFDGSFEQIASKNSSSLEQVKKIQQRFMYLEPKGVGARNLEECLLFQFYDLDLSKETYDTLYSIITNPKELPKALKTKGFDEINSVLKSFVYPPSLSFSSKEVEIIPDFIVKEEEGDLVLVYNDIYAPQVKVNNFFKANNEELKKRLKEARIFVELLNLRKKTLHKIVLCIINKQKSFFENGELKPFLLKDLAHSLEFCESTISRAVANKYIESNKGILSLRSFFSYKVSDNCSLNQVKNLLKRVIEDEEKTKPLSDEKLKEIINETLHLNLSRRAITKYRLALDIASSRDRKKLYLLS